MQTYLRANPIVLTQNLQVSPTESNYEVIGTVGPTEVVDGILTFQDTTAAAHQVYSYYIVAINQEGDLKARSGNHLCSTDISRTYPGPAKLTPAASCESVKLTWPATEDANGYIIERALKAVPTNVVQLSGIIAATSYTDYSVLPGESYTYRVTGVTLHGNITSPAQKDVTVPTK